MNNSRRKFLEKGPAIALAAGVGIASGKITMASPPSPNSEGTRVLLDTIIAGQANINGRLYAADELLLEVLRKLIHHVPGINVAALQAKIDEAEGYVDAVPGEPPGCVLPGGYGGG